MMQSTISYRTETLITEGSQSITAVHASANTFAARSSELLPQDHPCTGESHAALVRGSA